MPLNMLQGVAVVVALTLVLVNIMPVSPLLSLRAIGPTRVVYLVTICLFMAADLANIIPVMRGRAMNCLLMIGFLLGSIARMRVGSFVLRVRLLRCTVASGAVLVGPRMMA